MVSNFTTLVRIYTNFVRNSTPAGFIYCSFRYESYPQTPFQQKKFEDVINVNPNVRLMSLKLTKLGTIADHNLQENDRDQVCQVLRASLAHVTYAKKTPRACGVIYSLFRTDQSSEGVSIRGRFLQTVRGSISRGAIATLAITTTSVLEDYMRFHRLVMVEEAIQAQNYMCSRLYKATTTSGYTVKKISKTWLAHATAAKTSLLAIGFGFLPTCF